MTLKTSARREFVATLGGLALAQVLSGCDQWADKPVSIAAHVWVGYEPMFLARREGWLDAKQVRLLETTSATDSFKALAEGRADGAALTLDEMLKAREAGVPLTAVMVFDVSAGADMLVARAGIQRLADLKGRRIGLEPSSVGELLLAEILQIAGLTRKEVQLIPVSIDKHREAWRTQQTDAIITYEPVASLLLADGARKLFDSRQMPDTIVDVLAIRSDLLDSRHSRAIGHLISVHFQALDHLTHNPHDAAYRMASHLSLSASDVLPAFKGLLLPDVVNNYRLLAGAEPKLLTSARKLSAIMTDRHLLREQDPLISLVRADFLPTEMQTR